MIEAPNTFVEIFNDPEHAAQYADGPGRFVPGFYHLHRMASVLIREATTPDAHVMVHGAGGGLELEALAKDNPRWTFLGIDPAAPMLEAARARLGDLNSRVTLHQGYAEDAPDGPFDAATSFLTLHFLNETDRQQTVSDIVRRLRPGAPFIAVHCSFSQNTDERETWLKRHRAFAIASGIDPELAEDGRKTISESLYVLDPETDERILHDAGLTDITPFYTGFTWRGWLGRAT